MPWRETYVMNEKVRFIEDWLSQRWNKTQLSIKYGISRPTVNKWISRFKEKGYLGLEELSCRPLKSPNETPIWKQERILATKARFTYWGPKKIKDYLVAHEPESDWPADSTIGEILKRHGCVKPRKRSRKVSVYPEHLTCSERPSQVWNIDFKGDVELGNGERCYPLTISDDFSRYLLCCQGLSSTARLPVKQKLEFLFREYGQPEVLKSDNGVPFAARTIGGLSLKLHIAWVSRTSLTFLLLVKSSRKSSSEPSRFSFNLLTSRWLCHFDALYFGMLSGRSRATPPGR